MIRPVAMSAFGIFQAILAQFPAQSQTFEVSTINPSPAATKGYSFKYVGLRQFTANNHTLRECVGFAYDVSPGLISGGPSWLDTERYDIAGVIPGDNRPPTSQLLLMFQALLADRLKLAVHHEQKEESVYNLVLGESEFKLKENTSHTEQGALLFKIRQSEAGTMVLPARNASMTGFASLLQRSALDRPVFDRTGLSGRYDFDLEWRIDGTQFDRRSVSTNAQTRNTQTSNAQTSDKPDIFTAVRQLGLKLEPAKEAIDVLVIDHVELPNAN
ncbi:MAG TPA: TIGR03435 family protein [Bryobacteraceae bacterium]|jgi:uncharacterized protein (TIGR03435 family)|nr:TIGR03435 family protein [Bryobacteraceae bacterium]